MTSGTLIAPLERTTPAARPDSRRTYTCPQCGHVLRVSGLGRHRVYFELDNERLDDPVMNRVCPACGHRLAGKNPPGSQP
jgi:rubrerythrin